MTQPACSNQHSLDFTDAFDHITSLTKARVPILWVNTHEEIRFTKALYQTTKNKKSKYELFTWSSWEGIKKFDPTDERSRRASGEWDQTWQATIALNKIADYKRTDPSCKGSFFILRDFHTVLAGDIPRHLRDLYNQLIEDNKILIITAPCLGHGPSGTKPGLEPTLDKQITVINYELPRFDDIVNHITTTINGLKADTVNANKETSTQLDYTPEEFANFARALQGLTEIEIDNAMFISLTHLKRLDTQHLLLQKKQIVKKSEVLEYVGQTPAMNEVGGLDEAKRYFDMYKDQFSPEAEQFGIEPLKGVLLTGIPGNGKSLLAKAISAAWQLPLLRLDIGKVMGSLVGQSEAKMRDVVDTAEAIAPAILWVDEIEKGLSGTKSSNFSDGGTLSRVFGTLLTAMEERFKGIIIIATANDISALPPELIRRFNEVLFVDLPEPEERKDIFEIHLKKRKRDSQKLKLDMNTIVTATHKFTGSEIEKVVKEAITRAWHDNKSQVKTEHVLDAIKDTKPIAQMMQEKIDQLREWARNRARYASSYAARANAPAAQKVTTQSGRTLDLNNDLEELDEVMTPKQERQQENKAATASRILED